MKRKRGEREREPAQGFGSVAAALDLLKNGKNDTQHDTSLARSESRKSSISSELSKSGQKDGPRDEDGWEVSENRVARKKRKKLERNYPDLSHSHHARLQSFVKLSDLQNLVLYLLADGTSPQWLSVQYHQAFDKVVVLLVPGLDAELLNGHVISDEDQAVDAPNSAEQGHSEVGANREAESSHSTSPKPQKMNIRPDDYYPCKLAQQKLPQPLKPLAEIFSHVWPIKTPGDPRRMHSPMYGLLSSPIPRPKEDNKIKGAKPPAEARGWKNDRTPITEFIMTKGELLENGFAIHPAHLSFQVERDMETARRHKAVQSPADGWIDLLPSLESPLDGIPPNSSVEAGSILQGRQLLTMDCEMVSTVTDRFALARISLIDWDGTVVFDSLVKPPDPIKDYLTPYSGITPAMMEGATLTLPDIQAKLAELVTPYTIIAGHSLDSDLRALKISYPFIVDSTLLYPHPKGPPQKSSLKWLTQKYLRREIQGNVAKGHDSVEDARAVLDLVRQKCERGKSWGTGEASGEPIFRRLARTGRLRKGQAAAAAAAAAAGGSGGEQQDWEKTPRRAGAMVDWVGNMHGFGASADVAIACASDEEVIRGVLRAAGCGGGADGDNDGGENKVRVPDGGCDFVFARFRELEFERRWSPRIIPAAHPAAGADAAADAGEDVNMKSAEPPVPSLGQIVAQTVRNIELLFNALPERTAFIVCSGSGDPRKMVELQKLHARFKEEYATVKWDQLSVQWTDTEEQALKKAVEDARRGVGFIGVTPMKEKTMKG